ncbi:hypothetical protein Gotri_004801, partial [Gossypium trilobum]|nr:hypothetical protein [Gossypium trilobum]
MAAPTPSPTAVSLKLLIDPITHRVLFAEATKDFVDFLFNIMSLPVGTVIRLLNKQGTAGCIGNIYDSIENLSESYMLTANKDTLLKPIVPNNAAKVPPLLPTVESSNLKPTGIYRCGNTYHRGSCGLYVANDSKSVCPSCNNVMTQTATIVNPRKGSSTNEGGYVKGVVTYMIMDDLVVTPMSAISCFTLLNKFNIKDVGVLEEKTINIGTDEV